MTGLVLNGEVEWHPTGLKIPEGFSFEQWCDLGGVLDRVASGWQWWYGDWWNFGESRYGEKHAQALGGKAYQTKADAAWVASRYEVSLRNENLSWSHHRFAAPEDDRVEWLARAEANEWSAHELRYAIRESKVAAPAIALPHADGDWRSDDGRAAVLGGDFRERLMELAPGSVDLILTDPPYPKDDLPLYEDLARTAARLLGPRGILLAYAGNMFVPEILEMMTRHINYKWQFCLLMQDGSHSRIMGRHIMQAWKPVIAFTVDKWPSGQWVESDVVDSGRMEKELYEWQQSIAPARWFIETYTPASGLVVDPFLGVGTFGAAAVELGRRFVGVELDKARHSTAAERIAQQMG